MKKIPDMSQFNLQFYLDKVGLMSIAEALQIAVEADQFASDVGPSDIAYRKFRNDAEHLFNYALLMEQEVAAVS